MYFNLLSYVLFLNLLKSEFSAQESAMVPVRHLAPKISAPPVTSGWVPSAPVAPSSQPVSIYTDPYLVMTQQAQQQLKGSSEAPSSSWPHVVPGTSFPPPHQMVMAYAMPSGDSRWAPDAPSCYMGYPAPGQQWMVPRPHNTSRSSSPAPGLGPASSIEARPLAEAVPM